MSKKQKSKSNKSGAQYSRENKLINNNPALRNIRTSFLKDLQDLRNEIFEKCMDEIDLIREAAERRLIYDDASNISMFKDMAKKNPEKFVSLLRTCLLLDEEGHNMTISKFQEISNTITDEKMPLIVKKANILKVTSVLKTNFDLHKKVVRNNLNALKHILYEDLDNVCLVYLESYVNTIEPEDNDFSDDSTEELIETTKSLKDFKIRSYRELNDMAIQKGFQFTRQRGDHAVFTNSNGYITVIPQRSIGKGLQLQILKQIGER